MRTYHLVVLHGVAFLALPMTAAFTTSACSANIHDNVINIPNATINATADTDVDVNNVMPDQTVPVTMNVQNVYLIAPEMTPPPEHMMDAGHIRIYMDSTSTPPILITAEAHVNMKIPPETKAGKHKLICRVHRHDGQPTSTKAEVDIDVKVGVSIGGDGATTTPDGGTSSADANAATPDGATSDTMTAEPTGGQ